MDFLQEFKRGPNFHVKREGEGERGGGDNGRAAMPLWRKGFSRNQQNEDTSSLHPTPSAS